MGHDTRFKPLTGMRFGRLVALRYVPGVKPKTLVCECDCGKFKEIRHDLLRKGRTNSCGCLQDETRRSNGIKATDARWGHEPPPVIAERFVLDHIWPGRLR